MNDKLIFETYFESADLEDRFLKKDMEPVDVIIPIMNTNPLWRRNLLSFYREIPINRLLIGDAGSTDDSLQILEEFPRVEVLDQSEFNTLGYSIRNLIENVKTPWFIYLHADVFLPDGWFDEMVKHREEYDWFECNRRMTILLDYPLKEIAKSQRAYSGSQMGRKKAFDKVLPQIEDDYLYRNEDIIFMELLKNSGGRYGRVQETFHYHQVMNKKGEKEPKFERVSIVRESDPDWQKRTLDMQVRGLIKYTKPDPYLMIAVKKPLIKLAEMNSIDWNEFFKWIEKNNPAWKIHVKKIKRKILISRYFYKKIKKVLGLI